MHWRSPISGDLVVVLLLHDAVSVKSLLIHNQLFAMRFDSQDDNYCYLCEAV